ncbi:hypothetical protein ACM1TL_14405 [Lysinibacillus capsici]|uniref:hypothetical protein n=1 Tax=Lysinibacillus capsici TaxID=2115968 RepID=UPI0039FBB727
MNKEFLNIVSIETTEVEFKVNKNYQNTDDDSIGYRISMNPQMLQRDEDIYEGLIIMKAQIFDENYLENNEPFFLKLEVLAHFNSKATGKPFVDFAVQALNVTIPYVRSFITTLTAASGYETVTLPILSIEEILEQMKKVNE